MKNSFEQLHTDYVETRKVLKPIKFAAILIAVIFIFIPLAELITEFEYHVIRSEVQNSCFVGYDIDHHPLQFRELDLNE